jgi:UDP-N-acetylglucosamine 2-epimerase (non-hydrolysing)
LHRPSNVDDYTKLKSIVDLIVSISNRKKVIFPIHPRTSKNLANFNLFDQLNGNTIFIEPLGYLDFIKLIKESFFVLTDSGGIQEETTFLRIPCITLRNSTERPATIEIGTNYLVGEEILKVYDFVELIFQGNYKTGSIPDLWDGKAANRVLKILIDSLTNKS